MDEPFDHIDKNSQMSFDEAVKRLEKMKTYRDTREAALNRRALNVAISTIEAYQNLRQIVDEYLNKTKGDFK